LLTATTDEEEVYIDPNEHLRNSGDPDHDIVEKYVDDEKPIHLDDLNHPYDEADPYLDSSTEIKEADILDDHADTDVEQHGEQFDWDVLDDDDSILEENKVTESKIGNSRLFQCLAHNSSSIVWSLNIVLGIIVIGVAIIIHVVYDDLDKPAYGQEPSNISMSLELWFTWLAFMWVVSVAMHLLVEVVPWGIKTFCKLFMPSKTEITRMRLAVSYIQTWLDCKMSFTNSSSSFYSIIMPLKHISN
jgi:hypothetical protein